MTHPSAARGIARLGLAPHPEGGHYRETFRSEARVQAAHGDRSAVTSILFLLEGGEESRSHRVLGDEIWLHHGGDDIDLVIDGRTIRLGSSDDASLQAFVPGARGRPPAPTGALLASRSSAAWSHPASSSATSSSRTTEPQECTPGASAPMRSTHSV